MTEMVLQVFIVTFIIFINGLFKGTSSNGFATTYLINIFYINWSDNLICTILITCYLIVYSAVPN